jgi:carboxypeptidase C (cathepsin A)
MRFAWIESLMFSLLIAAAVPAFAADEGKDADSSQDKDKKKDEKPVPPEKTSVSHGSVAVGGKTVRYTATAGNVLIREGKEDKPAASVF